MQYWERAALTFTELSGFLQAGTAICLFFLILLSLLLALLTLVLLCSVVVGLVTGSTMVMTGLMMLRAMARMLTYLILLISTNIAVQLGTIVLDRGSGVRWPERQPLFPVGKGSPGIRAVRVTAGHTANARDRAGGGLGHEFSGSRATSVLFLLDGARFGGGLEAAQVHDPSWWNHILGADISQGALLKPATRQSHMYSQ